MESRESWWQCPCHKVLRLHSLQGWPYVCLHINILVRVELQGSLWFLAHSRCSVFFETNNWMRQWIWRLYPLPSISGDYGQVTMLEFEQALVERMENCWLLCSQNYPLSVVSWEGSWSWFSHSGMWNGLGDSQFGLFHLPTKTNPNIWFDGWNPQVDDFTQFFKQCSKTTGLLQAFSWWGAGEEQWRLQWGDKEGKGFKRQGMTSNYQWRSNVTYTPNWQYRDLKSRIALFL